MRLLNVSTLEFGEFFAVSDRDRPYYAILSHRWGEREVSYQDWLKFNGEHPQDRYSEAFVSRGPGYKKIVDFCRLVHYAQISWLDPDHGRYNALRRKRATIQWVWVDTCCIDKKSSAELSEAINSMYAWYEKAAMCFVHLVDYYSLGPLQVEEALSECEWFTRGWTLQELLAPTSLCFCDDRWSVFGYLWKENYGPSFQDYLNGLYPFPADLLESVTNITGIAQQYLQRRDEVNGLSTAQRMSWAARRKTTRVEDQAYCVLGIFATNMPLIYGESDGAFRRLQEEVIRQSSDRSILAHNHDHLLALSVRDFPVDVLTGPTHLSARRVPYSTTNVGVEFRDDLYCLPQTLQVIPWGNEHGLVYLYQLSHQDSWRSLRLLNLACETRLKDPAQQRRGEGARLTWIFWDRSNSG